MKYECDFCEHPMEAPDEMAGRQQACLRCGGINTVPRPAGEGNETAPHVDEPLLRPRPPSFSPESAEEPFVASGESKDPASLDLSTDSAAGPETAGPEPQDHKKPPLEIDGWLILPALKLLLALPTTLVWAIVSSKSGEIPLSLVYVVLFVLSAVCTWRFFGRYSDAPMWMYWFYGGAMLLGLVTAQYGMCAAAIIWSFYFAFSKRVKNTFVRKGW